MSARPTPRLHRATIARPDGFAGWRDRARALLTAGVAPEEVLWEVEEAPASDLFAEGHAPLPLPGAAPGLRVPRDLLTLLRFALMHRAPHRFALGYRILWRLQRAPGLAGDPADPDMIAAQALAKAVRRDIHKMHAFVRFRKTGEAEGREQFAAWFEPDHHIVRATAGFFRDRFAGMDWLIVTPEASIAWDGAALREGPGGTRADVPDADSVEAEWRAYYASIFNPARLKVDAMKREMPVRYWRNLPESALIPGLVQAAGTRVAAMVREDRAKPGGFDAAGAEPAAEARRFATLNELRDALEREDAAPSPGFSDRVVPGEGPPNAPVMLVGEQPGDQEDLLGQVFVGPAGQLLDACLAEAGVDRAALYLTNAVKRFKFAQRGKRRIHQTPAAGDVAHYRWWLAEEVRLVSPRVVIALGATALHALTGRKQALAPVRGAALPWSGGVLLPTVHPSFLLRLPDAQARTIERERFVRELRAGAREAGL